MADTRAKGQSLAIWLQLLCYYLLRTYSVRDRDGGACQHKLCLCSLKQSEIFISHLNRHTEVGISCPYKVIIGPTLKDQTDQ